MAKHDVWKTIFIGIVALGLLVSAASIGEGWLAIGMIVNGVWLAGWAGILTVDEIRSRMIDHEDYRNGVTTRTEAVRKLEIIQHFSPEQMKALAGYVPMIEALGGNMGPVLALRVLNDKTVQLDLVYAFFEACSDVELLAIRNAGRLANFSNAREQVEDLTAYLVFHGFAVEGRGPSPAQWVPGGYEMAKQWCGYGMIQLGRVKTAGGVVYPQNKLLVERSFGKVEG